MQFRRKKTTEIRGQSPRRMLRPNGNGGTMPSMTAPSPSGPAPSRQARRRGAPASQGQAAFSYYASRSQSEINVGRDAAMNKPPLRRLPTKLQRLRSHAGWLALGIVAFGLVVYQLQLSTVPRIVTLSATSDTPFLQETAVYQKAAHELFDTSAVNRNKLTVDSTAIAAKLKAKFPELQDVSVSMPVFGNQPIVYIRPAEPALLLSANNGSFIVDENGRALAVVGAATATERLQIPSVTDQSSLSVRLGDQVLPSTVTSFITTVNEQFKAKRIGVQSMILPVAAGELDVYVSGQPYFIKFNIQDAGKDADLRQVGASLAVINKLKGSGSVPTQYIDVRLEGRAYYL